VLKKEASKLTAKQLGELNGGTVGEFIG